MEGAKATAGRLTLAAFVLVALAFATSLWSDHALAQNAGEVVGDQSQSEFWRAVREGRSGTVAGNNPQAGILVQSEGEAWRNWRNGPLSKYGGQFLLLVLLLLAVFFIFRGRIGIDQGLTGRVLQRFSFLDRFGHWLVAVSFIILALSGLNLLFGRYVLLPLIGAPAFGTLSHWGKIAHNYVGFAFMAGVVLILLLWIRDNMPSRSDIKWIAQGGGILGSAHPPAKRFNFGQKVLFWLIILGGVSISLSGISLLFPFEFPLFAKTFSALNAIGFNFSTDLTPIEEMQYAQLWHAIVAIALIGIAFAHIYIGTIGMRGAVHAMASGEVDENWAEEHHSLWVEKLKRQGKYQPRPEPDGRWHLTSDEPERPVMPPKPVNRVRPAQAGTATERLADLAKRASEKPLDPEAPPKPAAKAAPAAKKPAPAAPAAKKATKKPAPAKKAAAKKPVADGKPQRPKGLKGARRGKADDLQRISGVGPKLEKTLQSLGFFHYDQIAGWTRSEVNWVDEHLRFKGRIDRDAWIAQAKLLAAGEDRKFERIYGGGKSSAGATARKSGARKSGAGKSGARKSGPRTTRR